MTEEENYVFRRRKISFATSQTRTPKIGENLFFEISRRLMIVSRRFVSGEKIIFDDHSGMTHDEGYNVNCPMTVMCNNQWCILREIVGN